MIASKEAPLIRKRIRAASTSLRRYRTMSSRARPIIAASDRGDWFTFQKLAIAVCSVVRVSAMCLTSASAATNASEPYAGGGGGRSSLPELRNRGRAPSPPRAIGPPFQIQNPGPMGGVPGLVSPVRSPAAKASTRAAAARPIASPASKFSCFPPGQPGAAACASSSASISAVRAGKKASRMLAEAAPIAAVVGGCAPRVADAASAARS